MTKFLYMADTHLGANPMGFQQQKGYLEKLPEILSALSKYLLAEGGIDFILHGGDMIDSTTEENIAAASSAFNLAIPVYLCLGNHDLTEPDAVGQWIKLASRFFPGNTPNYTIPSEDCIIHIAPNHWGDAPFFWEKTQRAHFLPAQIEHLDHELGFRSDLPHFILTHSPVYGLPEEQTGFSRPYHCPNTSFTEEISTLAAKHKNIKCVLGAHNHMNMHVSHEGIEFVTVSSLVETPFEFKIFEVTPQRMKMITVNLDSLLGFKGEYNNSRSFVQGREADRFFVRELSC